MYSQQNDCPLDRQTPEPPESNSDLSNAKQTTVQLIDKKDKKKEKKTSSQQMNMRGVFLHVLADALGSVIVCISAVFIMYTDWSNRDLVDPFLSVLMVILIMYSTYPLLKESAMILLQTVPTHIKVDSLQNKLLQEVGSSHRSIDLKYLWLLWYWFFMFFFKLRLMVYLQYTNFMYGNWLVIV